MPLQQNTIIGIDPGSRITGYGIIGLQSNKPVYIASGCIRTEGQAMAPRLQQIFAGLSQLIAQYQPTVAAIEQVFVYKNPNSALKLGQARGAALAALTMPVFEYTPRAVKQAVVGYGAASKEQVQHMIKNLLRLSGTVQTDAADALAAALCHAHAGALR